MKTIIALILLTSTVSYAKPKVDKDGCYQKLVTVCPLHKKKPKPIVVPGPFVQIEYRDVVHEVIVPGKCPPPTVLTVFRSPLCKENKYVVAGLHAALGLTAEDPYAFGQIGLRLRFPKAYLGLEIFSRLQYGVGVQSLIYVYQGPILKVHVLDPGIMVVGHPFRYLSEADIHRKVDLVVGLGLEAKITCTLSFTADWNLAVPSPSYLASHSKCGSNCNSRIDVDHALGNAFASSQLLVGLLWHN